MISKSLMMFNSGLVATISVYISGGEIFVKELYDFGTFLLRF